MKKWVSFVLALVAVSYFVNMHASVDADKEGVKAAVLDYVEGIYEVQPERIARSVDVTMRKFGYWRPEDKKEYRDGSEMNYKQLYNLAARWNKQGRVDPKTAIKEVEILDLLDKTASAKLVAHWGIDYFHLSKEDGKWKIMNVLWQSHPPKK